MITREEALEWSKKYMSRGARKAHPDHEEYMRRTEYMANKLYSDFEQHIKSLEAQLANTEQLTCESCKSFFKRFTEDGYLKYSFCDKGVYACNAKFYCAFHEPKETK